MRRLQLYSVLLTVVLVPTIASRPVPAGHSVAVCGAHPHMRVCVSRYEFRSRVSPTKTKQFVRLSLPARWTISSHTGITNCLRTLFSHLQ